MCTFVYLSRLLLQAHPNLALVLVDLALVLEVLLEVLVQALALPLLVLLVPLVMQPLVLLQLLEESLMV